MSHTTTCMFALACAFSIKYLNWLIQHACLALAYVFSRTHFIWQYHHMIIAPAIQAVCHMTPAQTKFFPPTNAPSTGAQLPQGRHPTRPISSCPTTQSTTWLLAPNTPSRGQHFGPSSSRIPNLGHIRTHRLPQAPLRIVKLRGGLTTGLETLLRECYATKSYA